MIAAQDVLLLVARVLMATMFFTSARDKFRLDATGAAIFLVLTGVLEGAGGVALVLGVYARVAAGALALFTVFVSVVFVRFWSFKGPTGNAHDAEKYFHRQRRDNRRPRLPRRTWSRRARAGGSLTSQG